MKTKIFILFLTCLGPAFSYCQNTYVLSAENYIERLLPIEHVDSSALRYTTRIILERYDNHKKLVEDELVKIIDKKRVVYPQHNFKTIDVTLVNQRLEICIGKHANSNLESEAFIFTYEYNSKKIIIQKLLKELPIALEEISIQTIGLLEKRKAIIKKLLPEYIEKDYKINADYFYDIEVLFDNSNQYLVFVIVSKQDSTKKLAYLYFDFEKNKVFASDLAVWQ